MKLKNLIKPILLFTVSIVFIGVIIYFTYQNLDFLNANSGALTLIFSSLVAIATIAYVFLTWKLVTINEELREPNIIVDFQPSSKWINFIDIIIKNIGQNSAYNIEFEITPDYEYSKGKYLSKLNFMKGINYLPPGREFKSFLMSMIEKNEGKMKPFDIKVKFENKKGKKLEAVYSFDFSQLKGISQIGDDPMEIISKSIKNISDNLDRVIRFHDRLKVEQYTQEDIKKINEESEKQRELMIQRRKELKKKGKKPNK